MPNILTELVTKNALSNPTREAYRDNTSGKWVSTLWGEVRSMRDNLACALEILGLKECDNITVFSAFLMLQFGFRQNSKD